MSFVQEFNDLFHITWHTDGSGNKISIQQTNEEHVIVGSKVLLNEIPDSFYKVLINGMVELNKGQKINNANEYVVDYLTGSIAFHPSLEGQTKVFNYYGRGLIKSFATRVLLLNNSDWNSTNLEDLAGEIKEYIDNSVFSGNYNDLSNKPTIPTKVSQLENDSQYANTNSVNALKGNGYTNQTLKNNYDLIQILEGKFDSIKEKPPVESYAELLTMYPNPETGTHVFVKGTTDINERGYYLYIDGETKIDNTKWVLSQGSSRTGSIITLVSGAEKGIASLDVALENNRTYVMEYEINTNNAPINSLYINNTVINNIILLNKNIGKRSVEFTTKSTIEINKLEIVLDNLSQNAENVAFKIISVKEKSSFMWRRDNDLIPLANSNRNGLLSNGDYNKIRTNESNIASNLVKINKNIADIATNKTNHTNHLNSTSAHKDDSISNTSVVAGTKVKDAINNLKIKDDQLSSRIDNLVTNQDLNPNKDAELLDTRNSDLYGGFASLDARLEGIEKRSKYFLRQVATVQTGTNTITLNQTPENHHELLIYDNKYSCIWLKNIHWTRSGNIITFTEPTGMPETLSFTIYNLG